VIAYSKITLSSSVLIKVKSLYSQDENLGKFLVTGKNVN
jgi:hypothetical protein